MPIIPISAWPRELKKVWDRAEMWLLLLIAGTLTDEYIKEGYLFHIEDVATIPSHEFIVLMLSIALAFVTAYRGLFKWT